jgi:protein-tyrosine phosphatase
MAEFVFCKLAADRGVGHLFSVSSAATSTEEIWNGMGNPVYPPAWSELKKHGIACDGKRAVQVTKADYTAYDYLLCMDGNNIRNLMRIIGSDPEGKVHRFMEPTAKGGDVADPWYTDRFDITYRDIEEGCNAWLNQLVPEAYKKGESK